MHTCTVRDSGLPLLAPHVLVSILCQDPCWAQIFPTLSSRAQIAQLQEPLRNEFRVNGAPWSL